MRKTNSKRVGYTEKRNLHIFGFGSGSSGGGSTAPAPAPAPAPAQTSPEPAPAAPPAPPVPPTQDQQLNDLAKLFSAQPPEQKQAAGPFDGITDESLQKAVSTARISTTLRPEALSQIFDNNPEKAAAFSSILDQVFQAGLAISARNAMKFAEVGLQHLGNDISSNVIPNFMKDYQVQNAVARANPMLTNPAYAPVYKGLVAGLRAQHPTATEQQLTQFAIQQLDVFVKGLQGGDNSATGKGSPSGQQTNTPLGSVTHIFNDDFFQ